MTQEEKQLLLKDLCARLAYSVVCQYNCVIPIGKRSLVKTNAKDKLKGIIPMPNGHIGFMVGIDKIDALEGDIKPYLRPLSSMTEEETGEMSYILTEWFNKELFYLTEEMIEYALSQINYSISPKLFDWLNAHHFDYRGLIPMGLALEAPKDMYKTELLLL